MEKNINVISKEIDYSCLGRYMNFVREVSVDANGNFHKYLADFAATIVALSMFTDYDVTVKLNANTENEEQNLEDLFKEIMSLRNNYDFWNDLAQEVGPAYNQLKRYVEDEVDEIKKPFASVNKLMKDIDNAIVSIYQFINKLDVDKINEMDLSGLNKIIEEIGTTEVLS